MAQNRDKAFEVDNGLIIDDSVAISSGSAAPTHSANQGDVYLRGDNTIWVYDTAWRRHEAADVTFVNGALKYNATNVHDALKEVRNESVLSIDTITSTLNGNHNILVDDTKIHTISGTATGFSVTLPDATALFVGRRFEIVNETNEEVMLKDNDGTNLLNLIAGDNVTVTLENGATTAGQWLTTSVSSAATGITSYVVTSNTVFSTTSSTDTPITSFNVTPASGRYSVFFSTELKVTQQNRITEFVIYVDGTAEENTRRKVKGIGNNFDTNASTIGEIIVDGDDLVEIHVNIDANSVDFEQRSLILIRLGA